jgi:CBS-domain-containing membrane protein
MHFFDEKFWDNKVRYMAQAAMGGLAVAAALVLFDVVRQPVIIASFGASGFIAFTTPHRKDSGPKYLIGGYIIGILVGGLIHYITLLPIEYYLVMKLIHILAAGVAVGLAMFLMTVTNTEHAPATSIALGLVINDWTFPTIGRILVGIILIVIIQRSIRRWMVDLI